MSAGPAASAGPAVTEHECEQVLDHLEELALGVAEARQRAGALAHLERCASCRRELAEMAEVADRLAALAPPVEPPAEFEPRIVAALVAARQEGGPPAAAQRRGGWRGGWRGRPLIAAAAAAVLAAAIAGGVALSGSPVSSRPVGSRPVSSRPVSSPKVVTAELLEAGLPAGQVVISGGDQPWISMAISHVRGAAAGAELTCELRTGAGSTVVVGSMWLSGGRGYWAGPLRIGRATVTGALVLGPGGAVLAAASIAPVAVRPAGKPS